MGLFGKKNPADRLFDIDKAMKKLTKGKKKLSKFEHFKLRKLLKRRAGALSDYYGVKIHPVSGKAFKKFLKKKK